ncbi:MAG: aminotransferase class V-fold PLP-dependent enzyme [Polyangiales bacterium]
MPEARLGDRSLFSQLRAVAYLNHAAISPLADPVRAATQHVLDDLATQGSAGFGARLAERQRLREDLARLMNAQPDEIALVPSTMYGLAAVAMSLPWRRGARVIAFEGEYPTNVSVWQRACERFGLTLTLLPVADFARPEGPDLQPLARELARGDVQLCAASAVQFQTGLRMPLAEIAALCHAHGAELAVDAVQALGSCPFDVEALGVDYAAAGSHKWLLGIDGAGVVYVRRAKLAQLSPAIAGALSHVDSEQLFTQPGQLRYDRPLRAEARVFEGGMLSSVGCSALGASVPLLLGLGAENIHRHVNEYIDQLEAGLLARGFRSLRAPDLARRSCTLGVVPPPSAASAGQLSAQLVSRGVVCSGPDGVLRFAPHFANARSEIDPVLAIIDELLR